MAVVRVTPEPAGPVVAVIDDRACGFSTVIPAVEVARARAVPMLIALDIGAPWWESLAPMQAPPMTLVRGEVANRVFHSIARTLAPYRLTWDFDVFNGSHQPPAEGASVVLATRHHRRRARARRGWGIDTVPLVITDCGARSWSCLTWRRPR